jgi:hypothetical protein
MKLFTAAETWFLKAEAALRGYSGAGDIQANYQPEFNNLSENGEKVLVLLIILLITLLQKLLM